MNKKPLTYQRSSRPNANEDGCLSDNYRSTWHDGLFSNGRTSKLQTLKYKIMEKIVEENTEFRIKWPRGQLGSLPADSEQYMMIEDLYKTTDQVKCTY